MTAFKQSILRAILTDLAPLEGGLKAEALIYAGIRSQVQPSPTYGDFEDAIKTAEAQGWIAGITNPIKGHKWAITDQGVVALRDL